MADPDEVLRRSGWCASGGGVGVFGEKGAPLQALSFGDELSHPITVISADFDCCVLPDQEAALVRAKLTVTNQHVPGHDIKATLRFPLPDGAVVSGFRLQIDEDMVDAMCVTKKKAAAVAYKEKEKGRAVATTEAVQGSIWSTEVFPLPYGAQRTVELEFRCECPPLQPASAEAPTQGCAWGLSLPLSFKEPVIITRTVSVPDAGEEVFSVLDNVGSRSEATMLNEGLRIAILSTSLPKPAIRVATCPKTGERHFSALVPASVVEQQLATPSATTAAQEQDGATALKTTKVAVVWDVSGSREPGADRDLLSLIDQLIASTASTGAALRLSVYTLGTELVTIAPSDDGTAVRTAVEAQMPFTYDGGTDLSLLNNLGKIDAAAHEEAFEYCMLATDGIDNFHRRPDMNLLAFPIYVALTQGGVHGSDSSLLQGIARLSGGVCMPLARSAELVSIASGEHEETCLNSLKLGGLDEDTLFDETLATVPDARIVHGRWALLDSGSARVSGCIPASLGAPSDVTIEVSRGAQSTSVTLPWSASAEMAQEQPLLGRLLSVSFAVAAVVEAESSQWDATAATAVAEGLMRRYGVASEHTTLLLLHEAVQFVDNDLECPAIHPEYAKWQQLAAKKEKDRAANEAEALARVQSKLGGMISGFVAHFGSLRRWKDANEDAWGVGRRQQQKKKNSQAVSRSLARNFSSDDEEEECCDEMLSTMMCRATMTAAPFAAMAAPMAAPMAAMAAPMAVDNDMALDGAMAFGAGAPPPAPGAAAAAGPPPPAPGAAAAAGPPPSLSTARRSVARARRTSPTQELAKEDEPDFEIDPMDDALVRASSLDSLDRQSSSSSGVLVAAVDGHAREAYLKPIRTALAVSVESGYATFLDQKATHGTSPSFYLYSAQAFRQAGAPTSLCFKIVTNVLEVSLCNAQTCRVVAYFVLSLGLSDLAVTAFENVIILAPEEPQSQTDLAFARFFRLRETLGRDQHHLSADAVQRAQGELKSIIALLVFVITKTDIPGRFREIEWPVLILLSWVVDWAEWRGVFPGDGACWPEKELPAAKYRLESCKLDIFIWLGWDTDHTDIDLHVMEPTGEEVSYAHNRSNSTGAAVSRDFTQDTLAHAPPGKYNVRTNYFGSHQDSETTGSTSCVIWSIRHLGDFEREEAQFTSVRLEDYKGQASCFSIEIAAEEGVPSAKA